MRALLGRHARLHAAFPVLAQIMIDLEAADALLQFELRNVALAIQVEPGRTAALDHLALLVEAGPVLRTDIDEGRERHERIFELAGVLHLPRHVVDHAGDGVLERRKLAAGHRARRVENQRNLVARVGDVRRGLGDHRPFVVAEQATERRRRLRRGPQRHGRARTRHRQLREVGIEIALDELAGDLARLQIADLVAFAGYGEHRRIQRLLKFRMGAVDRRQIDHHACAHDERHRQQRRQDREIASAVRTERLRQLDRHGRLLAFEGQQ